MVLQATAALRNLAIKPEHNNEFIEHKVIHAFTYICNVFQNNADVMRNVSRSLAKLSLQDVICDVLSNGDYHLKQIADNLDAHKDNTDVVLRYGYQQTKFIKEIGKTIFKF